MECVEIAGGARMPLEMRRIEALDRGESLFGWC